MNDDLSINPDKSQVDISKNTDGIAAALKVVLSNVPAVGSILTEVVGVTIPNQKADRIKLFVEVLSDQVKYIEEDVLRLKMQTEEFTDLFEDALLQAARALNDERRQYIASFLKNSLTSQELTHIEEKKLLSLLNELNDAEVIYLKYDSLFSPLEKSEFGAQHKKFLTPIRSTFGYESPILDKQALQESFRSKLLEVGLIKQRFDKPKKGIIPEFDEETGRLKVKGFSATRLGKLLLRYIDQNVDETENL